MRVLVIEDEPIALDRLCEYIARYDNSLEIVGKPESLAEAREWFRENRHPDLIFSDIELLDGNVFELLVEKELDCPVIFATAYDQFLLEAFEGNGIAYLLKPFSFEKFSEAMRKLEKLRKGSVSVGADEWKEIKRRFAGPAYRDRFAVKHRGGIRLLKTDQIAFLQIRNGLLFAVDERGERFPLNDYLTNIERTLDPNEFFRINRSEMVNLRYIERLEPYFNDRLVVRIRNSKAKLVSSINRTPALRKWIG